MGLQKDGLGIRKDTDLGELIKTITVGRRHGTIKKEMASSLVLGLLGHLYGGNKIEMHVPRKIHTVGELYSLTENEILRFKGYKKKTWLKLNDILLCYGLSSLTLPQEYTSRH